MIIFSFQIKKSLFKIVFMFWIVFRDVRRNFGVKLASTEG